MLEIPDNENAFAPTTAEYPASDIDASVGAPKGATTDKVITDADATAQIDGRKRRHVIPVRFPALAATYVGAITPGNGQVLKGWSIQETADGAADWTIHHGQDVLSSSPVIDRLKLVAGGTLRFWYVDDGIDIPNGISLERTAGTSDIILYIAHE